METFDEIAGWVGTGLEETACRRGGATVGAAACGVRGRVTEGAVRMMDGKVVVLTGASSARAVLIEG